MATYSSSYYIAKPTNRDDKAVEKAAGYTVETKSSGKFSLPLQELGKPIPYLCGTGRVLEPNIIAMFNATTSQTQTVVTDPDTGNTTSVVYEDVYFLDLQMSLCLGPGVVLKSISQKDQIYWTGSAGPGRTDIVAALASDLLDGGAIYYGGDFTQAPDARMIAAQPLGASGHPGIAYIIIKQAKINDDIGNITFDVERIPNPLALSAGVNSSNGDVNIATALVDVMTNDWGGAKVPITSLNLASFQTAATKLAAEGNFCSIFIKETIDVGNIIAELEDQARGAVYIDPTTGLLNFALIRYEGVSLAPVANFDPSNVLNLQSFGGGSWAAVANQKKVTYPERLNGYKQATALAQNISVNATAGRSIRNTPKNYPFVTNSTLANKLAARDLALECVPSFVGTIETNREGFNAKPGQIVGLTWPDYQFTGVPMIVTRMRQQELESERIVFDVAQLVYPDSAALIATPDEDFSEDIRFFPMRPTGARIIDAPFHIATVYAKYGSAWASTAGGFVSQDWAEFDDIALPLILCVADNADQASFDAYVDDGSGLRIVLTAGRYATLASLDATMALYAGFNNSTLTIQLNDVDREENLLQQGGPYFMFVGNEILSYTNPVKISPGVWTVDVKRGHFDTVAEAHGAGSAAYLISGNYRNYVGNCKFKAADAAPSWRLTGRTKQGVTNTAIGFFTSAWNPSSRFIKPIRPSGVKVNGVRSGSPVNIARGADFTIEWFKHSRLENDGHPVGNGSGTNAIETIIDASINPPQSYQQHRVVLNGGTTLWSTINNPTAGQHPPYQSGDTITMPGGATVGAGFLEVITSTGITYPGDQYQVERFPINIT